MDQNGGRRGGMLGKEKHLTEECVLEADETVVDDKGRLHVFLYNQYKIIVIERV